MALTTPIDIWDGIKRFQRRVRSQLNFIPYMPQAAVVYHEDYTGIDKYIADRGRAKKIYNYLLVLHL